MHKQKKGFFGVTRHSDFVNRLYILFYSSISAPIILLCFGLGRYQKPNSYASPYVIFPEWFVWLLALSCIGVAFSGIFLYKKRIPNAKAQVLLRWKVQRFLRASSYQYTLPAFAGSFAGLGYYMTGAGEFAIVVISILSFLLLQRPTTKKACKELSLQNEEISLFRSGQIWA
ncbi:hypothetical protein Fleli_3917 [Bernardetia litoralis DSM 6794]|uniref:Uncharacterized protein n=1 Tax=Bernardetia litoralis (strain ATCC 23117 / DSM 6794 / NBRC 15988 / NCIMB 1366 / Fx l1 / Sio-4) TaxID=880071 RepID=I4AQI5_BERLS|nr:hypothetical protein [Bernardetia litoralis]AFM06220.1 hypothetical protein Fleli_3917 [Bernardetia litoralis DSM 6794]